MTTTSQQVVTGVYSTPGGQPLDADGAGGLLDAGWAFLSALSRRDFAGLEECFAADAVFRALVPAGVREGTGPQATVAWLRRWFGDTGQFQMQKMEVARISDRLRISYRISLQKDGVLCLIEQQAYCIVANDQITTMNLLCSGFRPIS